MSPTAEDDPAQQPRRRLLLVEYGVNEPIDWSTAEVDAQIAAVTASPLARVMVGESFTRGGRYAGGVAVGGFVFPRHVFYEGSDENVEVAIHFEWRDGEPRVCDMRVTAKPEGRGVGMSDVQGIRLQALGMAAFRDHAVGLTPDGRALLNEVRNATHPEADRAQA